MKEIISFVIIFPVVSFVIIFPVVSFFLLHVRVLILPYCWWLG